MTGERRRGAGPLREMTLSTIILAQRGQTRQRQARHGKTAEHAAVPRIVKIMEHRCQGPVIQHINMLHRAASSSGFAT